MKINAQCFRAAATFASKDKTRPILGCVRVWDDKAGYRLVSTDSYKLIGFEHGEVDGEKSVRLSVKACHASSLKKSDKLIEFGKVDEAAHLVEVSIFSRANSESAIRTEYWELVDGNFPNYEQLLPKVDHNKPFESFEDNPEFLAQASKAVSTAFGDTAYMAIWGQGRLKPVWFEAQDKNTRCFGIIMPVRGRLAEGDLKSNAPKVDAPKPPAAPKVDAPKPTTVDDLNACGVRVVDAITGKVIADGGEKWKDAPKSDKPKKTAKAKKTPKPKKPAYTSPAIDELTAKFDGVKFTCKGEGCCIWADADRKKHGKALENSGFVWSTKKNAYYRRAA